VAQVTESDRLRGRNDRAPGPNILAELQAHLDEFPDALARIAKYIVENPEKVVYQSLADLSRYAKSGQASVVRLCQELGLRGFSELKLVLAAELARRPVTVPGPSGGPAVVKRLVSGLSASLEDTGTLIDLALLDKIAARLAASRRIDIYGAGVSGIAGEIVAYRLLRVGLNAQSFRDPNLAHEVANGLTEGCTAIAISESGVTPDTVEFLRCARSGGAYTIAIGCRLRSALAEFTDDMLRMAYGDPPSTAGATTVVTRVVLIVEVLAQIIVSHSDASDAPT
jgi:DNA-binding MurR/RpiR family transcriptional regulator